MRNQLLHSAFISVSVASCVLAVTSFAQGLPDQAKLEAAIGKKALRIEDEAVLHFYAWRRKTPVEWEGRAVEVFEGVSIRTSFTKTGDECIASGQWLLFGDETIPVVAALTKGGLRVASVVARFPGSVPRAFVLRFFGEGSEDELGNAVASGLRAMEAVREANATPRKGMPTCRAAESAIDERPLEKIFACKSEVKDGVALFRFDGPALLGKSTGSSRMGVGRFVSFAGTNDDARVRVDWTADRHDLEALLDALGKRGFVIESLVPAAPMFDSDTSMLTAVGVGRAEELATVLASKRGRRGEIPAVEATAFRPPQSAELLGCNAGKLADGWRSDATHPGGDRRARWGVDGDSPGIVRMSDPGEWSNRTFNLLWNPELRFRDGTLTVRMKADAGRVDQGGGLIWRVQDADNYYVTRFNPLEQDFRVYRVVNGVREQLQALGQLPYRSGDWFTIVVTQRGDDIACVLNGRETLRVRDTTFSGEGGVGVWSKADSQCSIAGFYMQTPATGSGR